MPKSGCSSDILAVARQLGKPTISPKGSFVETIVARDSSQASRLSLSGSFGLSAFPAHTDTAHWHLPARYILMECILNEPRVPTILIDSKSIISYAVQREWRRAVWKVKPVPTPFTCSMFFQINGEEGFRWDPCCMSPLGRVAKGIRDSVIETFEVASRRGQEISWKRGFILAIDNWRILHARPGVNGIAGRRLLQRVLVARE